MSLSYSNEIRFSHLNHKNIISFYDSNDKQRVTKNNKPSFSSCLLMEYSPYPDLASILRQISLGSDEKLIRTIFHQIINGIEYLHSKKIAHLDIKTENILIGEDYNMKLIDFDFAMTSKETVPKGVGTTNYRSPELKKNELVKPSASDIYSAGIVLFCLRTGCLPYIEDLRGKGSGL